jgi:hypothetical protein
MKYRWIGKNVEISDVEEAVKSFLEERKFKTAVADSENSKKITSILQSAEGRKKVIVTVTGKAEDFTVDFATSDTAQIMSKLAASITFFGGGPLQLKSLKEKEFYQKIEDQLWDFLEKFIAERSQSQSSV